MKATLVFRYFWPETVLMNDIARWLVEAGHEVEVLTGQPDYRPHLKMPRQPSRSIWHGATVRRLPLLPERGYGLVRAVNGLLFVMLASAAIVFGRRRDVVWTTSIPPVVQALALLLAAKLRGARFVYFLQDIYPDIAILMGIMKPGLLSRLLVALDRFVMNHADVVVVLSDDMMAVVRERGTRPRRLVAINNFSAQEPVGERAPRDEGGPARFLFAGNVGRFQNLSTLVDVFARVDPNIAVLDILGEGREKGSLEERVKDDGIQNVRFRPGVSSEEAFGLMAEYDVGIVTLRPGLYRFAYPSKTFSYLAAGLPVLALVEPQSALARDIEEHRLGVTAPWDIEMDRLVDIVVNMAARWRGASTVESGRPLYSREAARRRWLDLFGTLETGQGHSSDISEQDRSGAER
ncbi:glycosyltransferase family 4 protein [Aurantimonas marina]|uniref:glycosyltransferase family 4 protein n=1 Tax=Aurantimonas marina TaxID=2780508 RepID=UPI0019D16AF3|nr:glycosyltransferase family 4 protein [Aurantimonas marina]